MSVESKQQQRRHYWTMALLNLLETGAAAGVSKFTPLFLAARGLDVAEVGVVLAIAQVCRFLGGLLFGRVADKTGRFRGVLLWTNLMSVALALATTSLVAPWRGLHGWVRVVVLALLTDGYAFFTRPPVHKSSVVVGAPTHRLIRAQVAVGHAHRCDRRGRADERRRELRLLAPLGRDRLGPRRRRHGRGRRPLRVFCGVYRVRYWYRPLISASRCVLRESAEVIAS